MGRPFHPTSADGVSHVLSRTNAYCEQWFRHLSLPRILTWRLLQLRASIHPEAHRQESRISGKKWSGPTRGALTLGENRLTDHAVEVVHVDLVEECAHARKVVGAVGGLAVKVERGLVDILFMHDIV